MLGQFLIRVNKVIKNLEGFMILNGLKVVDDINKRAQWLLERQRVLSENVAHSETPDYSPQDLKPLSFQNHVQKNVNLKTTHPAHITRPSRLGKDFGTTESDTRESTETGNGVVVQEELIKMADTKARYREMLGHYKKIYALFEAANIRPM